jgi:hypothetical protein
MIGQGGNLRFETPIMLGRSWKSSAIELSRRSILEQVSKSVTRGHVVEPFPEVA